MPFKDETAFKDWSQKQEYSPETTTLINRIRNSPPSRNVSGGGGNVRARVPSRKMGVTIQSESRTVEKPGMRVFYEYDDVVERQNESPVIEYYDQPEKITLKYRSKTGRRITAWHTPDFFVIRENGAGWEEWKTESELQQLMENQPNRYCRDETGQWRCPPGETYAAQFSMSYRLRSNAEVNWILYSNLEFLHEYLANVEIEVSQTTRGWIAGRIKDDEGISLADLLQTKEVNADDIYMLVAQRQIYVDLSLERLIEPERVQVFTSQIVAEAKQHLSRYTQEQSRWYVSYLEPGCQLIWDGEHWELVNLGIASVRLRHLQSKQMQDIPRSEFEQDIAEGKIESKSPDYVKVTTSLEVKEILSGASEADYAVANARLYVLKALNKGQSLTEIWSQKHVESALGLQKTKRTIRRWQRRFSEAETIFDNGYIGLIPTIQHRGNYQSKISEAALEKMEFFIETRYEDLRQSSIMSVWVEYRKACEAEGISPVSLMTFTIAVKKRPKNVQVKKRQGKRAAHQVKKHYWYLEATTPKHGERTWHIVHIDHTQLDIQLVHSRTGKVLGRPWVTFAVDAYSRRLLAVALTLDEGPSYRNCMLVLRELVRRLRRLPQSIYVDNGLEFHSTYFQTLLAQYGVEIAYRPPAQPRFGDVVERLFRTANSQFVHTLTGNTQIAKQVRLMTKLNDPERLAIWNLGWLNLALCEWAYEVYDQAEHTALGQSPREAFTDSLQRHGERTFKWIDYDTFVLNALPAPRRGKLRKVHPSGVKINNIYYWHDWMYRPDISGSKVAVRYDPFNVGIAYAYLDKEWVRCTSEYFPVLSNRSEQEIQIAREEIVASCRRHGQVVRTINARLLANFLERTITSERLLKQQQRDNALRQSESNIGIDELLEAQDQQQLKAESTEEQERLQQVQRMSFEHLTIPDDF
jgi:putative transposase